MLLKELSDKDLKIMIGSEYVLTKDTRNFCLYSLRKNRSTNKDDVKGKNYGEFETSGVTYHGFETGYKGIVNTLRDEGIFKTQKAINDAEELANIFDAFITKTTKLVNKLGKDFKEQKQQFIRKQD